MFGDPGAEAWGWRVGGHHLALNYTVVQGRGVSASPLFLGANPAATAMVGAGALRPLAEEEDLGRRLVLSLAPGQLAAAVTSEVAPDDVLETNRPAVEGGPAPGLAADRMTPEQRAVLGRLVDQYLGRLPDELAGLEAQRVSGTGPEALRFAWAGGCQPGQPHYYRVQGARLLIEYDNVQGGANHAHSVWRDPAGDFGAALLSPARRGGRSPSSGRR